MSEIILYDLPSRGKSACWSLNPWKARAALNYKGLPYRTEWTEYPDLEPKFKSLSIPPNDPNISKFDYSSPAVKLPDGSYVMESLRIATALDKLQPDPPLFSNDKETIDRAQTAVLGVQGAISAIVIPRVPELLLGERSAEYFNHTRAKRFGMSLEELAKSANVSEAWEKAAPHLKELNEILMEKEGKFVLGEKVSFADFVIAGFWAFVRKVDKEGDVEGRVYVYPSFKGHWEACRGWFERDD
ncbi:hypothetical protein LTR09_008781 [Extremus antarcticus]|uniref:GST N-terminal domain-containing protein n=1 Tax=Extremus antarcticus TaxID=702011 RepID=A0AAJ0DGR7_9PEZI|nr:hypothetical protein LTR09_008781 [Extremus antarcticus]